MKIVCLLVVLLIFGVCSDAGASPLSLQSVLAGTVVTVVHPGDYVQSGQALVTIRTGLGFKAASVRALTNGVVQEVYLKPGDYISNGQPAVLLDGR